ncbi:hypothetical protein SAMN05216411_11040 [Nitrosospira multiformis]|nr:hypothetical protein SAMN05216411_11040 [Nitrosospira multiformis]
MTTGPGEFHPTASGPSQSRSVWITTGDRLDRLREAFHYGEIKALKRKENICIQHLPHQGLCAHCRASSTIEAKSASLPASSTKRDRSPFCPILVGQKQYCENFSGSFAARHRHASRLAFLSWPVIRKACGRGALEFQSHRHGATLPAPIPHKPPS